MTSLNQQMEDLIQEGFHIIQKNETLILQEWERFLHQQLFINDEYMTSKEQTFKRQLKMAIVLLRKHVFDWQYTNYQEWMEHLQSSWNLFHSEIERNHLVLIFSLLEKGAHKVSKHKIGTTFHKHQAIQYFFGHVVQKLLNSSSSKIADMSSYIKYLLTLEQLPVQWVARVKHEENQYQIKDIIQIEEDTIDKSWINMIQTIKSETLDLLTTAISRLLTTIEQQGKFKIFHMSVGNETLLFLSNESDWHHVKSSLTLPIKMFESNFDSYVHLSKQNQWKDILILFQQWLIQAQGLHELIERIASGYIRYLPFERCAFFSYTDTEKTSIGLTGYHFNTNAIKNIKENVTNIPLINKNVTDYSFFRPLFYSSASTCLPDHYVRQFKLNSIVISPIYTLSRNKLLGAVILDQGEDQHFEVSNETMIALLKIGHLVGEILMKFQNFEELYLQHTLSSRLSPREIEVLQCIKKGDSIEEVAENLHLSKYTVRDYISTSIKKMNAKNRIHAVSMAIHQGLI